MLSYSAAVDINGGAFVGNAHARLHAPLFGSCAFFGEEAMSLIMGGTVPGAVFKGERTGIAVGMTVSICAFVDGHFAFC